MNLQRHYELEKARDAVGEKIIARVTPIRLVSSKKSVHPLVKALTRNMSGRVALAAGRATPATGKHSSKTKAGTTHLSGAKTPALSTKRQV